jgi:hypothetical protein
MEQMDSTIKAAGLTLMIVITVVLVWRYRDPWRDEFEAQFKRALASLDISDHEFIVDRVISPRGGQIAEVYPILRDPGDRYFFVHADRGFSRDTEAAYERASVLGSQAEWLRTSGSY